jgi:hypothetical protein
MTNNMDILSISDLPIELIYRIFNHLDLFNLLMSVRDVCTRLDQVIDIYQPYQVIFILIFQPIVIVNRFACDTCLERSFSL